MTQDTVAWYDDQKTLNFQVRMETFPELGMKATVTIEIMPIVVQETKQ